VAPEPKRLAARLSLLAPVLLLLLACSWPGLALARLDLASATVERLDNGLTVIVLEEPAFPLVSVQMLYRVGAKHEPLGATGLAHFLEHMAFRSSENFPDTGLVSSIYAAGGEWHGYTWLDQTTYFATAPREELDLLLRIEADRMARLLIPAGDVTAEIGAVLAEMHGYENDPATVLQDHVLYISFLAHPYRNNTIGWESDVSGIRHDEVVEFYQRHYQPGNAVLAVVGDVRKAEVVRQVRRLFGPMTGRSATPNPRTVEPPQQGERRIRLQGAVDRKYFKIAWRAPSVHSPDFAPFLVLQELLAGGSGVSFLQNDWGTPARAASPLGGINADVTTWYPPSEQDYVFTVSGSLPAGGDEAALEDAVQLAIEKLAERLGAGGAATEQALQQSRQSVRRELLLDVQTTEDAAHQLAFFGGMDALTVLNELPAAVVDHASAAEVRRVLHGWLGASQRTIGWFVPQGGVGEPDGQVVRSTEAAAAPIVAAEVSISPVNTVASASPGPAPAAAVNRLRNGTPVILQRSPLSPSLLLKVVVPGEVSLAAADSRPNEPVHGVTSLDFQMLPEAFESTVGRLHPQLAAHTAENSEPQAAGSDPEERLAEHFQDVLGLGRAAVASERLLPLLFVVSGDIDPQRVQEVLDKAFGQLPVGGTVARPTLNDTTRLELESNLDHPVAQEQLGYVVRAPGPGEPGAAAWWMTLYILSHGYEGRLGKEAISRRGLVYYIGSAYRSDGVNGWVTLSIGVDPAKLPAMRDLLRNELRQLQSNPPTQEEVDEARRHLLGRQISAAQSNQELADRLAREWLWHGELLKLDAWQSRLSGVDRDDVLDIVPAFVSGSIVAVRNPRPAE
jgi:predicted Zn-dependent peptidase